MWDPVYLTQVFASLYFANFRKPVICASRFTKNSTMFQEYATPDQPQVRAFLCPYVQKLMNELLEIIKKGRKYQIVCFILESKLQVKVFFSLQSNND